MKSNRLYFLVTLLALATLGVAAVALWQPRLEEWRWYQDEFVRRSKADLPARLAALPDEPARAKLKSALGAAAAEPVAIRQIWVPELGQVSRCTTCHVAVTNDQLARPEHPFTHHPAPYLEERWHSADRYGCLVCHGGNGRATLKDESHGEEGRGELPRRTNEYAQASCGKCHQSPTIAGAPDWNAGRWLARDRGCSSCHDFAAVAAGSSPPLGGGTSGGGSVSGAGSGGSVSSGVNIAGRTGNAIPYVQIGPPLVAMGSKTNLEWLTAWIADPRTLRPRSRMPKVFVYPAEAAAMAQVLMATQDPVSEELFQKMPVGTFDADLADYGRGLALKDQSCATCHDFPRADRDRGGHYPIPGPRLLGPSLEGSGDKLKPGYVAALLDDPQRLMAGTAMPRFGTFGYDREGLVAFVLSLRALGGQRALHRQFQKIDQKAAGQWDGRLALQRRGCTSCHWIAGLGGGPRIGPNLADVADRRSYELDWGTAQVAAQDRHLLTYLLGKVDQPGQYRQMLPDPPREMTDRALAAMLAEAATAATQIKPPAAEIVARGPDAVADHLLAEGKRLGILGARAQLKGQTARARLLELKTVLGEAGAVNVSRMPTVRLTGPERREVVTYLLSRSRAPWPPDYIVPDQTPPVQPLGGRFVGINTRYRCTSCHSLLGQGGEVGPALDGLGSKVHLDWLNAYLAKPTQISDAQEARMPQMTMSPEEIDRTVVYLNEVADARVLANAAEVEKLTGEEWTAGAKMFRHVTPAGTVGAAAAGAPTANVTTAGASPGQGGQPGEVRPVAACVACHQRGNDEGGLVGPNLGKVGERLRPEWIYTWLQLGRALRPDGRMPTMNLDRAQARALTAFLLTRTSDQDEEDPNTRPKPKVAPPPGTGIVYAEAATAAPLRGRERGPQRGLEVGHE